MRAQAEGSFTSRYIFGSEVDETVEAHRTFSAEVTTHREWFQFIVSLPTTTKGDRSVSCQVFVDGELLIEETSDTGFVNCGADIPQPTPSD